LTTGSLYLPINITVGLLFIISLPNCSRPQSAAPAESGPEALKW
jgi:hypothetical protein